MDEKEERSSQLHPNARRNLDEHHEHATGHDEQHAGQLRERNAPRRVNYGLWRRSRDVRLWGEEYLGSEEIEVRPSVSVP
ncbi:hypothetical protein, partial [Streptomyces sp. NPDC057910]|uniref:hypothetical protein n=1 Tax=Streptomyces sp. NPDC057910 TaxID=3346278 RepID=UPI0036ED5A2F